jgi:hypothetical protein
VDTEAEQAKEGEADDEQHEQSAHSNPGYPAVTVSPLSRYQSVQAPPQTNQINDELGAGLFGAMQA